MTIQLIKEWVARHKWGLLITALALLIRTWNLGTYPMEFTTDEAALGYNAYSLLKTGHDENGQLFPVVFKSFGDYKPGLYIYLTIPFIVIGGLTESMVRMPSALAGTLAVFLVYIALRLIRNELPYAFLKNNSPIYASLALALNPWHILFSRGAWESNLSLTMTLFSLVCALYAIKRGYSHLIVLAGMVGGLTLSAYQGAKMATPLFAFAFFMAYYKVIKQRLTWGYICLSLLVALSVSLPILQTFLDGRAGRLSVFSILNYSRPGDYISQNILTPTHWKQNDVVFLITQGEWLTKIRNIFQRYSSALSPRFLFIEGDWEHTYMSIPYQGAFYWTDFILLVFGMVTAIKLPSRFWKFVLFWIILAPLPAALSRDPINAVRSLYLVVPLSLLVGLGACQLIRFIKLNFRLFYYPSIFISLTVQLILFAYFADLFINIKPMKITQNSYYGYKQVVEQSRKYFNQNIPIIMSQSYAQPYIYFLFFNQIDPEFVQKNLVREPNAYGDAGLVTSVGPHLQFREIHWDADKQISHQVLIGDPVTTIHPQKSSDTSLYEFSEVQIPAHQSIFRIVYIL